MRRKPALIIGAVAAVAAVSVGVGLAARDTADEPPATGAPATSPSAITPSDYARNGLVREVAGLPDDPAAALQAIAARSGSRAIASTAVGGAPPDFGVDDNGQPLPPELVDGVWAYLTVDAPSRKSDEAARAIWEADLVSGAFRDAVHASGRRLIGAVTTVRFPDGSTVETGGLGEPKFQQQFSGPAPAVVDASLRAAAEKLGLKVKSIDFIFADQIAPAVVLEADPAVILERYGEMFAEFLGLGELLGDPPRYEGFYLEIHDPLGELLVLQTSAFRTGVGRSYLREDLRHAKGVAWPVPIDEGTP